jgi:hypothetical protein
MTNEITPPLELVQQWATQSPVQPSDESWAYELFIVDKAVRWSSDQELEACCEWLVKNDWKTVHQHLRAARRPKPLSLKEKALLQLDTLNADLAMHGMGCDLSQIRRAIESLPS